MKPTMAAMLAVLMFVFSGGAWAEPGSKPFTSDNRVFVTQGVSTSTPQEGSDDRVVSVVHVAFPSASTGVLMANIPFGRYINCAAFFVNSHSRNAIYVLPSIHAP